MKNLDLSNNFKVIKACDYNTDCCLILDFAKEKIFVSVAPDFYLDKPTIEEYSFTDSKLLLLCSSIYINDKEYECEGLYDYAGQEYDYKELRDYFAQYNIYVDIDTSFEYDVKYDVFALYLNKPEVAEVLNIRKEIHSLESKITSILKDKEV